ncbi:AraC family transcriptional regulator [Blautia liquoris]|nr:AraC family transcriptional regulator [Blautia liquoris]
MASPTAPLLYFYPACIGHYFCNGCYSLSRTNYNSFLFLYVIKGNGFIKTQGQKHTLAQGNLGLIDCYEPHQYYTEHGWEILWMHFDGPLARRYFDEIMKDHAPVFHGNAAINAKHELEVIYRCFDEGKSSIDESELSYHIVKLITPLLNHKEFSETPAKESPIKDTLHYISQNIDSELSVSMLAERIYLSKYHFIRIFKKETGYTPHEYILMCRVNAAAYALKSTSLSAKDIALQYGFSSESSFSTTFKKRLGASPRSYRLSENDNS